MAIITSGRTDIGQKRKTNQDSIYLNKGKGLFIVADGMGGHKGGDIASALAVKVIPEYCFSHFEQKPGPLLADAIQYANRKIKEKSNHDSKLEGMGTTVVGLLIKKDSLYIANVGDSRAYLIVDGKIYQLSRDHSLVQEKLNMGIYGRDQAHRDPQKNVLVRTVGFDDQCGPDIFAYRYAKGDIFLICSDGLHGKVSDEDMLQIVNYYLPDPKQCSQSNVDLATKALIDQANRNGGNDNISVILTVYI